jgi:hypothetical protein
VENATMLRLAGEALLILGGMIAAARIFWPGRLGKNRIVYRAPLFIGLIFILLATLRGS